MDSYRSPLLTIAGAVDATGIDEGIAWHYGDPLGEQRGALDGCGLLDLSNRDVLIVPGPDRLEWLHAICSQHLSGLSAGQSVEALVLSMNGHVEQHWMLTELGDQVWIDTEPKTGADALAYLIKMRFLKRVEPALVTEQWAQLGLIGPNSLQVLDAAGFEADGDVRSGARTLLPGAPADTGGGFVRLRRDGQVDLTVSRSSLSAVAERLSRAGAMPVGTWASAALRVQQRRPRLGLDTDHRTLAHEAGWIGSAVHLDKGCYRGQETVARVQNMGKAPRRLVLLHLGGESDHLPPPGTAIQRQGRAIGVLGTAVHHHELGPIALGLIKRTAAVGEQLVVGEHSAAIDRADEAGVGTVVGFAGRVGPARTTA